MKRASKISSLVNVKTCVAGVLAALCFIFTPVHGQAPAELYKTANQLYKANLFDSAAAQYERILAQGYKSVEVYYNLGNCYYKLNNLGKGIINYERALQLAPDDEDIQHNLKLANLHTADKIQPVPQMQIVTRWNNFVESNSSRGWGMLAVGLIWISLIVFAIYLFFVFRRVVLNTGVLFLVASLFCMSLAFKQSHSEEDSNAAVLTVTNAFAKSAPDASATDAFMIHEGIKFHLMDQVGDWVKIRLADGKVGWVEKGNYEKI